MSGSNVAWPSPLPVIQLPFVPQQAFRSWATLQDILGTFQHKYYFFNIFLNECVAGRPF